MDLFEKYTHGYAYDNFLAKYATEPQLKRWRQVESQVSLTDEQKAVLGGFRRTMKVLCLAGAWCGDCSGQCPVFTHFAAAAPVIEVRYLDRDEHPDVQLALKINGGDRVPVLVFFSEDGYEVARYGERTLSRYRQLMRDTFGASCPTGIIPANDPTLAQVTQDWLNEFERVQWLLCLSTRLRRLHGE